MRMNSTKYYQTDSKWGWLGYPFAPWYIRNCGCGEVSVVNVIIEMEKYKQYTPTTIQPWMKQYAESHGNGTYHYAIPLAMKKYGLTEVSEHATMNSLWKELAKGGRVAILLMGSRNAGSKGVHWTGSGHFVGVTAYKKENGKHRVYVKDSASGSGYRNGWITYEENLRGAVLKCWSGKLGSTPLGISVPGDLVIDGIGGPATIKATQKFFAVDQNGTIYAQDKRQAAFYPSIESVEFVRRKKVGNDRTVKALQKWVGVKEIDGVLGKGTVAAWQKKLKDAGFYNGIIDGYFGYESMVAWQNYLNNSNAKKSQGKNSEKSSKKTTKKKSNKPYQNLKPEKFVADKVIIGQACCDEHGRLQGGAAGDQTKKEVRYSNWAYSSSGAYHWKYVFRAKDKYTRLVLAQAMRDCYKNNNIGYDIGKPDRFTAYDEAKKHNWDISKIDVKCETTCSQAVSMCMRAAGFSEKEAPRFCNIAVITEVLQKNEKIKMYKGKNYTTRSFKLEPGDMLLSDSHIVIVTKAPQRDGGAK